MNYLPGVGKIILVIEDEFVIRDTLKQIFELDGYDVMVAENGQVGLDLLITQKRPNLILLDMMMPIMDGIEFLEKIAHYENVATVPVVVVSAVANEVNSNGAIAYVRKPINLDSLLTIVAKYSTI